MEMVNIRDEISHDTDWRQQTDIENVGKELLSPESPEVRTQLSHDEVNQVSKLLFLGELFENPAIAGLVKNFIVHRISLDRQSRQEFRDTVSGSPREEKRKSKWFGRKEDR